MIDCTKTDVQKLSDEHPQRTYLSEFLENYPNAQLKTVLLYSQLDAGVISLGIPKCICPYHLGLRAERIAEKTITALSVGISLLRRVKNDDG